MKKKKITRETLETQVDDFCRRLPAMDTQEIIEHRKQYASYNSTLGCYDEVLKTIDEELTRR